MDNFVLEEKKNEIIEKYKEKIKRIYRNSGDEEIAHGIRDEICMELIRELGYKEIADLLEKAEKDIGFYYM